MTQPLDFQKPLEAVKALMSIQAETIGKSLELQKKSGEELMKFFQTEAEKARALKSPEDLIKFNVDANTALFGLIKAQGEAFTALATEASQATLAKLQGLTK